MKSLGVENLEWRVMSCVRLFESDDFANSSSFPRRRESPYHKNENCHYEIPAYAGMTKKV